MSASIVKNPQRVVLVVGVFDLFHRGHLELLIKASSYGSKLVVVVNGDKFTAQYKRQPVYCEDDRAAIVGHLKMVDAVEISNSNDVKPFIEKHRVNVIVHGDDWEHASYLRQIKLTNEYIIANSIEMFYTPYYNNISTSQLINKLKEGA